MHLRNPHHFQYNFTTLTDVLPALKEYVFTNKYGTETIDFHNPNAVKVLNRALLKYHYNIDYWDIPDGYLCPPIPGRADYIHHLADLIQDEKGRVPRGEKIRVLDIGTGANGIYPLIGYKTFGWSFVGTEVDDSAIRNLTEIISKNSLDALIEIRKQDYKDQILKGVINRDEYFDLTLCNPPFYKSEKDAKAANLRKYTNLKSTSTQSRNFAGQSNELWYPGGEIAFIKQFIQESVKLPTSVFWYTSLVSQQSNVTPLQKLVKAIDVVDFKVIPMEVGNKKSRFIAWTFLSNKQRKVWKETRWGV